ncbi:MAG: hypothetical protein HN855_16570 [Anaerolineae bacterium]|jgi:hypothetical protein|nr:hypothetical protein [Anaerolineae bacterium]MBT7072114.1 hypothetical protein [Anaerolineae bacterium]MBT7326763.1 hypothetical protein [Anaerolineae bacterium]MBT7602621.1 hypothetical protein [Anaerolineae bacterium]
MIRDLNRGILLEGVDVLLPWDTPKDKLQNIGNPILQESSDRFQLYWNEHIVFGGIKTQVKAVFYKSIKNSADHPNANGKLHIVNLNFYPIEELKPREQYEHLKTDFIQILGTPSPERKIETKPFDQPFTEWELPSALVVLMVFERFGEHCVGEIWHKPLPAWRKPKS